MKISDILTKLGLKPEDQKLIEESIQALIDERVLLKEEELKTSYDTLLSETLEKEVEEKVEEIKTQLVEASEKWQEDYEKEITDQLDGFIDAEIEKNISDEALDKIAINEVALPIVEGIKKLYEENHIELNADGSAKVKELSEKVEKLTSDLNESISKNIELENISEKAAVKLRINEVCDGLDDELVEQVKLNFSEKSFADVDAKIDNYIEMIVEEKTNKENKVGSEDKPLNESKKLESDENVSPDKAKEIVLTGDAKVLDKAMRYF